MPANRRDAGREPGVYRACRGERLKLTAANRELEESGRRAQKGERTGLPLSARTVRYVSQILGAALGAAVNDEMPLLELNPNAEAKPPTAKEAKAPEMHPWAAEQLRTFLDWARSNSQFCCNGCQHVASTSTSKRSDEGRCVIPPSATPRY